MGLTDTNSGSECPTCKRLSYDEEALQFHELVASIGGKFGLEDCIQRAMDRATVKKTRREHIARVVRYFIGEVRSARP